MPQYRVTMGWETAVLGRSETYISPNLTDSAAPAAINQLLSLRNALLYDSTRWRGVRLAIFDATTASGVRRSNFYPPGSFAVWAPTAPLVVPASGTWITFLSQEVAVDQGRSVMQVRVRIDNNRFTTRYFAFVPDGLIRNELYGLNFAANGQWATNYNTFANFLINNGWGVRGRRKPGDSLPNPPIQSNIQSWVTNANPPGYIGIVLNNLPSPGIAGGTFVQVQGVRRRGTDKLSYNGRYYVEQVVPNSGNLQSTYYLRGTEAGDPTSVKLPGTVYPLTYASFPIQQMLPIRGGVRKTGRPLGTPTGRRQKRISLDP